MKRTTVYFYTVVMAFLFVAHAHAQQTLTRHKSRSPIGFFPSKTPQKINGIAIGPFSLQNQYQVYNGLTIELIGTGLLAGWGVGPTDHKNYDIANGITFSLTGGMMNSNGVYIGGIGRANQFANGVSLTLGYSDVIYGKGIIISGFNNCHFMDGLQIGVFNGAFDIRGVQIGVLNETKNLKGVQIGIWNENRKRKLPFINWNFD